MAGGSEPGPDQLMAEGPPFTDITPERAQGELQTQLPPSGAQSKQQGEGQQGPSQKPRQQASRAGLSKGEATSRPKSGTDSAPSPSESSPVPASFPTKRRGRPPGRPNTTVRDADYDDNPLVQAWNAARGERAVPVVAVGIRAALTERSLVHDTQRAIFRLPSRETIHFVQGWITAKHIASQRPSYVNGLLIHSRGQDAPVSCAQCAEKRAKNALGPFVTCRVLPGSYHNSCSNCKWFDNTSACSLYTGPKPNRKRKAKEQLAPPRPAGAGPAQSKQDGIPGSGADLQPQPQPAGNMASARNAHRQEQPATASVTEASVADSGAIGHAHTEADSSELADAPSQPDSLAESHFTLTKDESGEGAQHGGGDDHEDDDDDDDGDDDDDEEEEDADFVAAQLAAQLLPEIRRQDA